MPIPINDVQARVSELDAAIANDPPNADELQEERARLKKILDARDEYDHNEDANMSSTDATIEAGRSSQPINKLKDKSIPSKSSVIMTGPRKQERRHKWGDRRNSRRSSGLLFQGDTSSSLAGPLL